MTARRFTEEELNGIIADYKNGMIPKELSEKYGRNSGTIIGKLKSLGIFKPTKHRYTHDEIEFIREHYPKGELDVIFEKMPFLTKSQLHTLCSKHGISAEYYGWLDKDVEILEEFYYEKSLEELREMMNRRYTCDAIQCKALKLGYSKDRSWTEDEIDIMKKYYPIESVDEVAARLSNRTRHAVIGKAVGLGLSNKFYLDTYWSDEDEKFLVENWKSMSDKELAEHFGREVHAIVDKRGMLGFTRVKHYNEASYLDIKHFIRGNIGEWKAESMKNCGYRCVLTGDRDFHIHHVYGLAIIFDEIVEENNIVLKNNFSEYTKEELEYILKKYIEKQKQYPLGVCVRKDLHRLFHQMYGQYTTSEMWDRFAQKYKNGEIHVV